MSLDADEVTLLWPERPTCHDHDPFAQRFEPPVWRPADERDCFRTCSFCGSIHPEDLYSAILAGARLGGSDWKYGWPHKFYVEGIPNTNVGKLQRQTSSSIKGAEPTDEELAAFKLWVRSGGEIRVERLTENSRGMWLCAYNPQDSKTRGKWYNTHLNDLNPTAFSALAEALMKQTNIQFTKADGELVYLAPRPGYQKA